MKNQSFFQPQPLPLEELYGDSNRVKNILQWFITLILAGLIGGMLASLSNGDTLQAILVGSGILPILVSYYLVQRKNFELASVFLAVILIGLLTLIATKGLGIHHIIIIGYPTILIVASLVTRRRTLVILTIYTIGCVAWLVFGELYGLYRPAPLEHSVPGDFFSASIIIILTTVMVRLVSEALFQSNMQYKKELRERKQAEEKIRQQAARAEVLAALSEMLIQVNPDYQMVLDTAVRRSAELIGDGASIFLYSPDSEFLRLAAVYNPDPRAIKIFQKELAARPIRANEGAYARAILEHQPVLVETVHLDKLIARSSSERREYYKQLPLYSMILAPLYVQGKTLGVIGLGRHAPGKNYTSEDLIFLQDIADRVALVMLNAQYYSELEQELTERKQAEAQVRQINSELENRNAELERFTYTVSHDLKSPLITISGFLGYLETDARSGNMERIQHNSQRIQDAVNKMHLLLGDLLELSRIGRLMNPPQNIPFEELVEEALLLAHGRIQAKGITIQSQPNLPAVHGDRQRLVEVLQNLLDNAAKFMGPQVNPHIEIGQHGLEGDRPVFFVRDNGIGIAPEFHENIFGLFNKLDADVEGTGVGLALVKRIIEFHGGRIWVESQKGQGATFFFTLPQAPQSS